MIQISEKKFGHFDLLISTSAQHMGVGWGVTRLRHYGRAFDYAKLMIAAGAG